MNNKPDIIEFIERHCGVELLECEKDMLRKLNSIDDNVTLVYPRWNGYSCYQHLSQAVKEVFINYEV